MRQHTDGRQSREDAVSRYEHWSRVHQGLMRFVEETRSFRGLPGGSSRRSPVPVLHRGERAFLALAGVHLIEARHSGGRFVGGTKGVPVRLPDGARGHVGGTGGMLLPGTEQPTSVDVGALVITDRRAVLHNADTDAGQPDHEWLFRYVVAVHHEPDAPWTALEVTDRRDASGFFYGHADVHLVRFRLGLALAVHSGTVPRLRAELESAFSHHLATKPPFP
jgi:hypothetical protein